MVIGLVSDTHSLVRPGIFEALEGVELILHAGDVGGRSVLQELKAIAPVRAVYGNCDLPDDPALRRAIHLDVKGCRFTSATVTSWAARHPKVSSRCTRPTSSSTVTRTSRSSSDRTHAWW